MSSNHICVPGQRLCAATENTIGGTGTYERLGYLHANISGVIKVKTEGENTYVEVDAPGHKTLLPIPGDVVTAKITVINQRFAKCLVICIGDVILNRPLKGLLRKEDVRATDKDRIEMYKCFKSGDVILAKVLPQTELHCYHLTTAENELGVVVASSKESKQHMPMVPISWTEMQCPETLVKEPRKVAKIVPENALVKMEG